MTTVKHPLTINNLIEATTSNDSFIYNQPQQQSTDSIETSSSLSTIKLPSSAPQSSSSGAGATSMNVPPNLIRKKSGELVKSSLKLSSLPKSMSTSQLLPNKSVRFASRLTNIKMFDGTESPSTVSTTDNTPIHSPQYFDDDMFNKKCYFQWSWDDDEISDITSDTSSDDENMNPPLRLKYDIDSTDLKPAKNIYDKQGFPCYLQSIKLNPEKDTLVGLVMVKNIAFEKKLSVKLTFNGWNTNLIINNVSYCKSFQAVGFDQFKFQIPLNNLSKLVNIELVIKYEVNGSTYWDNNNGNNYHINLKPFTHTNSNTIKNYSYGFNNSIPQFDELVNKLMGFKKNGFIENDDNDYIYSKQKVPSPTKVKSDLHTRYNINDELDNPRSGLFTSSQSNNISISRAPLRHSFSSSDILDVKPAKYSQSFKSKQIENESAPNLNDTKFNSKSYSDLLQTYCFYNGEKNSSTKLSQSFATSNYISSPASTFYSLSDSVNI